MSYHYSRLHADGHRDVAHWHGARAGVRVLSLPSCAAWLLRQANDDCYDHWPGLAIGMSIDNENAAALWEMKAGADDVLPPAVYVMQQDPDGAWFIDPWHADQAVTARRPAANGAAVRELAHVDPAVIRPAYQTRGNDSRNESERSAAAMPETTGKRACATDEHASTTCFIIEISAHPGRGR
jgi:hypothetical protein